MLLERLSHKHQSWDHEYSANVAGWKATLGLKNPGVPLDVAVCKPIVKEMPKDLAEGNGDDGREVHVADAIVSEAVTAFGLLEFDIISMLHLCVGPFLS